MVDPPALQCAMANDDPSITNASSTEWCAPYTMLLAGVCTPAWVLTVWIARYRVLFNAAVVCALMLDLLVVSDGGARGSKQAAVWTMVWIAASLLFLSLIHI